LTEAPTLATPKDEGLYVLDADVSDLALGVSLQQEQEGELGVIGYASTALSDAEKIIIRPEKSCYPSFTG